MPLRTMARMTVLRPGHPPPPVRMPIFTLVPSARKIGSIEAVFAHLLERIMRPELAVNAQGREFFRTNQYILKLVVTQKSVSIGCTRVHAPDLGLALRGIPSAGPQPS